MIPTKIVSLSEGSNVSSYVTAQRTKCHTSTIAKSEYKSLEKRIIIKNKVVPTKSQSMLASGMNDSTSKSSQTKLKTKSKTMYNGFTSRLKRALVARRTCEKSAEQQGIDDVSNCWCEDISSQIAASAFRALGDKSFDENDFDGALIALSHELTIKRLTLGSADAEVGKVLNHMAVRMTRMGPDYEFFALSAFAEALCNLQGSVGPGAEEAAVVAHNLWVLMHNVRVRQEELMKKASTTENTRRANTAIAAGA